MGYSAQDFSKVYKGSVAVSDLGHALASYFSADRNPANLEQRASLRTEIAYWLQNDAQRLPFTVKKAYKTSSRTTRIQQLNYLNTILTNLLAYCRGLEYDGIKETEYLGLFRYEIRKFNTAVAKWRNSLHKN